MKYLYEAYNEFENNNDSWNIAYMMQRAKFQINIAKHIKSMLTILR